MLKLVVYIVEVRGSIDDKTREHSTQEILKLLSCCYFFACQFDSFACCCRLCGSAHVLQQWRCAHDIAVAVPEIGSDVMSLCRIDEACSNWKPPDKDGLREFWIQLINSCKIGWAGHVALTH